MQNVRYSSVLSLQINTLHPAFLCFGSLSLNTNLQYFHLKIWRLDYDTYAEVTYTMVRFHVTLKEQCNITELMHTRFELIKQLHRLLTIEHSSAVLRAVSSAVYIVRIYKSERKARGMNASEKRRQKGL